MHDMLLLLLVTTFPAVIGYALLLRQQDREGGFCVTDDDHRTVVFIPVISRRPPPPSALINAQQPWTSEWQFENMYEQSKYWSADRMWHDLSQISTYASDVLSHPHNFDRGGTSNSNKIYVSVLAKSVEISLKLKVSFENNDQYQIYVERNYDLSVDAYNHETNKKELRRKMCTWRIPCPSSDFINADFLENGASWVHLEFNIFISAKHQLEINIRKRDQEFHNLLLDNTMNYRSIGLISASFKTNEVAAFFKLHDGLDDWQNNFAVISKNITLQKGTNVCLDIAWFFNLPSELHLEIKLQQMTIISRSYISPSFEFDMNTRLIEYLPSGGTYNITLKFKSLGRVSDVHFCNNKKDAIQIIQYDDYLKGCQLLGKAGQNDIVIDSNCIKTFSSTPTVFPYILPAICSNIEGQLYGFCENYKVCDHLQCSCIHKEASTISPSTANTEPQLSTSIPESADQNCTQDLSKNSSCIGTTSNEALCPWSQQLLTLLMVVLSFLCVVIVILTVMAVQSYKSLKELEAADDCTPQDTFEMQPIPGSSTNTG